jgi:hypothetical protein
MNSTASTYESITIRWNNLSQILEFFGIGEISNEPEPVVEPISNKRFIFMVSVGIALMVAMKVLLPQ